MAENRIRRFHLPPVTSRWHERRPDGVLYDARGHAFVRPYPYDRWPKLSRADVQRLSRELRAHASPVEGWQDRLAELVGERLELRELRLTPQCGSSVPMLGDSSVAAWLRHVSGRIAAVELDPTTAAWLLDRVLGGDGHETVGLTALRDIERGLLAFLAARVLGGLSPWKLASVTSTTGALHGFFGEDSSVWLGTLAGARSRAPIRIWTQGAEGSETAPMRPRSLPDVPIPLCANVGITTLAAREIASLRRGDLVLLDELAAPRIAVQAGTRVTLWCDENGGTLRVVEIESHGDAPPALAPARVQEATMSEDTDPGHDLGSITDRLGDAVLTVSVELARFTLPLEVLAQVQPGEVLLSGHPLDGPVRLIVGGKVVAQGQLVQVEGEVGVRVTEVTPEDRST